MTEKSDKKRTKKLLIKNLLTSFKKEMSSINLNKIS